MKLFLLLWIFLFLSCSSFKKEYYEKDLPRQGCIVYDSGQYRRFERVIVIHEHEELQWEVLYPDSKSKESYYIDKQKVHFIGCPWNDVITPNELN